MQNILDCSFLQVTINSNKLMHILEKLTKQTNQNSSQIRILREVIPTIKQSVYTSLEATQSRIKIQSERTTMKIRQQLKQLKLSIESVSSESQKSGINMQKKLKEKEIQINKLDEEKKRIQTLINMYEENRLICQNKIYQQIQSTKQSFSIFQKQHFDADAKVDEKLQMMFIKIQSLIKKNNTGVKSVDSSFDGKGRMARNSTIVSPNRTNFSSNTYANWAKFSNTISQLEKKCQQSEQCLPQMNKILYSRKRPQQIQNKDEQSEILDQNQPQAQLNLQDITQFFSHLNEQNKKSIQSLKNKLIIQQQKVGINSRKLQKMVQSHNQFRLMLKRIEEKKSEDHNYQSMKNEVKKIHYEITQELDKKVNRESYDKEKKKIFDKIYIIQENLTEKAEKGDMKKAFLFMEQKIKQLIVLIASDQGEQKDGAIRKVPVKCLSCDKGLQTENTPPNTLPSPAVTSRQGQNLTRAVTRKIRTRIQASNQNSSINL